MKNYTIKQPLNQNLIDIPLGELTVICGDDGIYLEHISYRIYSNLQHSNKNVIHYSFIDNEDLFSDGCAKGDYDILFFCLPEVLAHPTTQCDIAKKLVKLMNNGKQVVISTNSDYIVKELNTLIMLSKKSEHTIAIQKKYDYSDNVLLSPDKCKLYHVSSIKKDLVF